MQLIQKDLPTGRLSFTQVDTYLSCPKKYEWRYIIKPEMVGGSPTMAIGSALHELLASVLLAKMKGQRINTKRLMNESNAKLRKELMKIQNDVGDEMFPLAAINMLCSQHDGLFEKWLQDLYPELQPTAVESEVNVTIGGYPFIMYLDMIHMGKRIIDWKVTASPKNKYHIANSLQLTIYSIGAQVDEVAFGSLVRPKAGSESKWKPSVQLIVGQRTEADRRWAVEVVKAAAQGIRSGSFPVCSPENFLCDERYCDFFPICRGKDTAAKPKWMEAFI